MWIRTGLVRERRRRDRYSSSVVFFLDSSFSEFATTGLFSYPLRSFNHRSTMHIASADAAGGGDSPPPAALVSEVEPPASFLCKSGVLLWGQMNTVIQGSQSLKLDTIDKPSEISCTRNIIQHAFRFKVAARKGRWRVEPAFMGRTRFGFVCFHEDVDGVDILRRAVNVGISKHNDHDDSAIVYVNEYDWSWSHGPNVEIILQTLGIDENDASARIVNGEEYYSNLVASRFLLLDEQGYIPLIRSMRNGIRLNTRNYVLGHHSTAAGSFGDGRSNPFGVHLSLGEDSWERGWMVFSEGVLVGFVYDGANTGLQLGSTTQLSLGNTLVEGKVRREGDDLQNDETLEVEGEYSEGDFSYDDSD
ncbi:hypothetical protein R1sor_018528 [Riccia sorocarpa]|uniref:Uncharacterized protein n=1 Tax=Riccia sorocarpa TaxID=122646 RepID=A0ABD3IAE4_9MARC